MTFYNENFFAEKLLSVTSARQIVPLVLELFQPKSVVDVGCGVGTWLSVFAENGVQDFLGIDGNWVDFRWLQIPQNRFAVHDLTKPFKLDRQFDLVLSLEVAEHIDNQYAEVFVNSLTRLGPVILFSAAIPRQGGVNHVNERWPNYWETLFRDRGYVVIDAIRKKVWQKVGVDWWYAQNALIFADAEFLNDYPLLKIEQECTTINQLSLVHPELYLIRTNPENFSFMQLLKALPVSFKMGVVAKLSGR